MSKLISELLAISRMDKNTIDISLERIDISELLNFVCDEQEDIHTENIVLKRNIMPDIFATTDSMLLVRIYKKHLLFLGRLRRDHQQLKLINFHYKRLFQ